MLFDTNVFVNALAQREPPIPGALLEAFADAFVAAPTRAELSWLIGRLNPDHPGTARVVTAIEGTISRIDPAKVLVPTDADWLAAGALAGRAARAIAGGATAIATAADRQELIADVLTAILARSAVLNIITEDADFDVLARLLPGLSVLFYDRA
ncbi:MAG TPA: PIN domain-containing protein [Acetobacteraceae bacterium]